MQKEKNIRVTSGIPRTPSSSFGSGGMFIGGSGAAINADLGSDGYDVAESLLVEHNNYTENKYNEDINNIAQAVEAELAQIRAAILASGTQNADAISQELNALNTLLSKTTTEHQEQTAVANLFYGHDPLTHIGGHPSEKGFDVPPRLSEKDFLRAVEKWNVSFAAAYRAKLLTAKINIINTKVTIQTKATEQQIQVAYTERLLTIPQVIESELVIVRARGATDPVAPVAAITRELSVRDTLIAAKIAEANKLDEIANAFFGSDPKDSVSFLAATNEKILEKYGANMSKVAQDLQTNISGKKIRSYSEALATFDKVNANPKIKLNAQDTQAVVDALNALDKATFADNVNRLGKAFGVVGKIVQADAICKKTIIGFKTGDWKPLGLEFESMAAGAIAGAAVRTLLAAGLALLGAPVFITIPAVAIVMAYVASFLDSEKADEINGHFIN